MGQDLNTSIPILGPHSVDPNTDEIERGWGYDWPWANLLCPVKAFCCVVTDSLKCLLIGDKQYQVKEVEWLIVKPSQWLEKQSTAQCQKCHLLPGTWVFLPLIFAQMSLLWGVRAWVHGKGSSRTLAGEELLPLTYTVREERSGLSLVLWHF